MKTVRQLLAGKSRALASIGPDAPVVEALDFTGTPGHAAPLPRTRRHRSRATPRRSLRRSRHAAR